MVTKLYKFGGSPKSDDYLTKPFGLGELEVRVGAI